MTICCPNPIGIHLGNVWFSSRCPLSDGSVLRRGEASGAVVVGCFRSAALPIWFWRTPELTGWPFALPATSILWGPYPSKESGRPRECFRRGRNRSPATRWIPIWFWAGLKAVSKGVFRTNQLGDHDQPDPTAFAPPVNLTEEFSSSLHAPTEQVGVVDLPKPATLNHGGCRDDSWRPAVASAVSNIYKKKKIQEVPSPPDSCERGTTLFLVRFVRWSRVWIRADQVVREGCESQVRNATYI